MTTVLTSSVFLLCTLLAVMVLGLLVVVIRSIRLLEERLRAARAAPLRGLLIELVCEDDEEESAALRRLTGLDQRRWEALEPTAAAMLGKVTGRGRDALVELFERRGAVEGALAGLRRRGTLRRARSAELIGELGHEPAAPALLPLLDSRDPDLRAVAGRALGRLGDVNAVPALLDRLDGHRRIPPAVATSALIRLGPVALPAIRAGLGHRDAVARAVALDALASLGDREATDVVAGVLRDDPSPEVRVRAAHAMGFLGTRDALEPLLDTVDPAHPLDLRVAAAEALGILGAVRATPRLTALLRDPSHRVAAAAGDALLRIGPAGHLALDFSARGADGPRAAAYARAAIAAGDRGTGP
ncbi:HEAT repeat domain-containing protein [Streptomyces meridianus]|uniref:HEAT repeat domain-containing protein n=1 Tax=Streptomyces meridianus TaxID=2938945 RepID=A0ABT0XDK2_9ACTN|nr:HEAT repeat domain-containing protein [Streptomyces meridianus]MCM2580499.1 HEAT repeat domain-containing protein [Streptomyces meridianus]